MELIISFFIGFIFGCIITTGITIRLGYLKFNLFSNNSQKNSNNKVKDNKAPVHIGDKK